MRGGHSGRKGKPHQLLFFLSELMLLAALLSPFAFLAVALPAMPFRMWPRAERSEGT